MFFYEIGYTSWDESPITTLSHSDKFATEEFDEILLQSYVKANSIAKKRHSDWFDEWLEDKIQKDEELDKDYLDDMRYNPNVTELNQIVIDILLKEYGFKKLKIQGDFIPVGSYITPENVPYGSDATSDCEKLNLIRKRITVIEERDKKINKVLK